MGVVPQGGCEYAEGAVAVANSRLDMIQGRGESASSEVCTAQLQEISARSCSADDLR